MSNYTPTTTFAAKDALTTGDPNKKIQGSTVDVEFTSIQTAVNSKFNTSDLAATQTVSAAWAFTATQAITVADGTIALNLVGPVSKIRLYGDVSGGAKIQARNVADNAYKALGVDALTLAFTTGGGVNSEVTFNGVAASDFARQSQANTFSLAGANEQIIQATTANRASVVLKTSSTTRGYFSAAGGASDLIVGSAAGDLMTRVESGAYIVSLDAGASINHKFTASSSTTTLNGIAVSDFARLSQADAFLANGIFAAGVQVRGGVGTGSLVIDKTASGVGRFRQYVGDGTAGTTADDNYIASLNTTLHFWAGASANTPVLDIGSTGNFDFKGGTVTTNNASASEVGYKGVPRGNGSAYVTGNYTGVLTDADTALIYTSTGGHTITIPANGSVAYPLGTVLTFVHDGSGALSIAITTDTLVLAGSASSGTRSLAVNGIATAIKVENTRWLISGPGVS